MGKIKEHEKKEWEDFPLLTKVKEIGYEKNETRFEEWTSDIPLLFQQVVHQQLAIKGNKI